MLEDQEICLNSQQRRKRFCTMTGQKLGPRSSYVYCDQTESKMQGTCCLLRPDWIRDPGAFLSTAKRSNLGPTDSFVYYDKTENGTQGPFVYYKTDSGTQGLFCLTRPKLEPRGYFVCCYKTESGTQGIFCLLRSDRNWDPRTLLSAATRPNLGPRSTFDYYD